MVEMQRWCGMNAMRQQWLDVRATARMSKMDMHYMRKWHGMAVGWPDVGMGGVQLGHEVLRE